MKLKIRDELCEPLLRYLESRYQLSLKHRTPNGIYVHTFSGPEELTVHIKKEEPSEGRGITYTLWLEDSSGIGVDRPTGRDGGLVRETAIFLAVQSVGVVPGNMEGTP